MIGKRNEIEERRIRLLLAKLGRRVQAPTEEDLRDLARTAASTPRELVRGGLRRPWRSFQLRLGFAVGGALLLGSGLGFGFGTWFTPSSSAKETFHGLGFLPASGWTVVQSETRDAAEGSTAVASSVPLHREDESGEVPYGTLRALPANGVVIVATLSTRGNASDDTAFPVRVAA